MPYTHQWRRLPELDRERFKAVVNEVTLLINRASDMGLRIAGPTGHGKPELSENTIAFNGDAECGHRYVDYGAPWPTDDAEGLFADPPVADEPYWSGAYLRSRSCHGGSCAAGAFVFDRSYLAREWERPDDKGYACKCETLFKPYDLLVTAALIRIKEHFHEEVLVNSDGKDRAFEDAKRLCRELFGWPRYFELEPTETDRIEGP